MAEPLRIGARPKDTRVWLLVVAAIMVLTACRSDPDRAPKGTSSGTAPPSSPVASPVGSAILASSFEGEVCGRYHAAGDGECEFGVEGEVEAGSFDCRTGESCVRIGRMASGSHMGVIALVSLPAGHAFVGVAHRVPELPADAIPIDPGYLQLEQLSPTDGTLPAWPVEVRLYPDRTLGLGLYRGNEVARTVWSAPVDRWFSLVVEVSNGIDAKQSMWIYDDEDRLVERIAIRAETRQMWAHANRAAQKVGGTVSALVPLYTYADDWYISETSFGPARVDAEGWVLSG